MVKSNLVYISDYICKCVCVCVYQCARITIFNGSEVVDFIVTSSVKPEREKHPILNSLASFWCAELPSAKYLT